MRLILVLMPAAFAACLTSTPVAAQAPGSPPDTAVVEIEGVQVRGSRPVVTRGGASAVTARLDSLAIGAVPTVEQVLRAMPGTYLRTNSRGETEVTVRGSESRQVAVMLDGVPLTYAWDGRADVSVIPALAIEEVTLVRGLTSLAHGPNALGGVVELKSLRLSSDLRPRASLRAGVDEPGAHGVGASITLPRRFGWGVLGMSGGVGHRDTPGQPLARGIVEPVAGDGDRRLNTDLRETNGFVAVRAESDRGPFVSLLGAGVGAERGIAAQLGVTAARFWRHPFVARGIGVLTAGTGRQSMPWGGRGDLEAGAGYDRGRTEIDAFTDRTYATIRSEEDGDDEVLSLRATASQTLGDRADVRLGVTSGDVRHDEILDGVRNAYRQRLRSGFAQSTARVPGVGLVREFDASAGVTFDAADTPETGNKPPFASLDRWGGRVGLAAHFGAATVHASASERARFPSLRELYSGALGSFEPNPDLKPEVLRAFEAGVSTRLRGGLVQVVGFHHRLADAVVRIRPPGQNFRRVNQEGIRSVGAELLASQAAGALELSADAIVQDVAVLDPAAGLTRPENMPEVLASLRVRAPLGGGIVAVAEARYIGEQFALDPDSGRESRLAPSGQLNLEAWRSWTFAPDRPWLRDVQLRLAADNVTDAVQYEGFGLPSPGRTLRAEVRVH